MSVSWNNEIELKFLEEYQMESILWDAMHPSYKNKNKKLEAWLRLSDSLQIPIDELKKKRDSMMASYRAYKRKVKNSALSGVDAEDVYKPTWFAYDYMDSFLGDGDGQDQDCPRTVIFLKNVSVQWNNELELKFLEKYQMNPMLWDATHPSYKDRAKKLEAWLRISDSLQIPIDELKKKRDSMMASYRGYKRKIKHSILSGADAEDVYRPIWFAYDYMNSFLGEGPDSTGAANTEENAEDIKIVEEIKEDSSQKSKNQIPSERVSRRRFNPPELRAATKQMGEAFNVLKKVINDTTNEDDCDIFGRLIAKKLKKVPDDKRENLMIDIQRLIQNYLPTNTVASNESATDSTFSRSLQRNSSSFVKHNHSGLISSTNPALLQKHPSPVLVLNNSTIIQQALLEALQK